MNDDEIACYLPILFWVFLIGGIMVYEIHESIRITSKPDILVNQEQALEVFNETKELLRTS